MEQHPPVREFNRQAKRGHILKYLVATEPDDAGDGNRRENFDHRIINRVRQDSVFEGVHVNRIYFGKLVVSAFFAIEQLQHNHSAYVLLEISVNSSDRNPNATIRFANPVAKHPGCDADQWQHSEGNYSQLPVHEQHNAHDASEDKDVLENRDHAGGEYFVYCIHVRGDACHQPAHGIPVEKGNMHALQETEYLGPQIKHHFLPSPLHEI